MNLEELQRLVSQGESEHLEFKRSTAEVEQALRTACGMLNKGIVGRILFGVTNAGKIIGQQIGNTSLEEIAQKIQSGFEPPASIGIERIAISDSLEVIALRIEPALGLTVYHSLPYERVGRTTKRMASAAYQQQLLEQAHTGNRWELQTAEEMLLTDLDESEVIRTVEEAIRRGRLDDPGTRDLQQLLVGLGVMDGDRLLNAAIVLFGRADRLQLRFPQCVLRLARFRGISTTEFVDNRQEIGNVFDLLIRGQRFYRDYLPIAGRIVPSLFERIDDPLYPPEALREALANALCHRDYRAGGGSVNLAIFDDRLEITSTGPLPFGQTPDDLTRPHQSRPWNPTIARVFYLRGIIETWGRGTLKMIELTEAAGLPQPEFEANRHQVTVRFRAASYVAPTRISHDLTVLQQRILTILSVEGPSSLSRLRETLGADVPERTLQDNLQMLKSLRLVELSGTRRMARWSLRPLESSG